MAFSQLWQTLTKKQTSHYTFTSRDVIAQLGFATGDAGMWNTTVGE